MCKCPNCGYNPDFIKCEFLDCQNEAEYEGWYRVLDFNNQPTGLTQKVKVCKCLVLNFYSESL